MDFTFENERVGKIARVTGSSKGVTIAAYFTEKTIGIFSGSPAYPIIWT